MSDFDIKKLNKLFNNKILPIELDYSKKPISNGEPEIDWDNVRYNSFFKTFDYQYSKFPDGIESLPGWEKIIDSMVSNAKTPLDEILERQKNISNDNIKDE